jgi:hypothetical protein
MKLTCANQCQTLPQVLEMNALWGFYYLFAEWLMQITASLEKNRSILLNRQTDNLSDNSLPVLVD